MSAEAYRSQLKYFGNLKPSNGNNNNNGINYFILFIIAVAILRFAFWLADKL